jgi:hypothetical protein
MKTDCTFMVLVLAAVMMHLAACSSGGEENSSSRENPATPAEIEFQVIERKDVTREIEALARSFSMRRSMFLQESTAGLRECTFPKDAGSRKGCCSPKLSVFSSN